MKYAIKINEVKGEDTNLKAFATITFGDSLVVRNIAIVKKNDSEDLFVSMPSHRTNEVTDKGEPIYRDICNPITKEFYEEITKNVLNAYESRKELGVDGLVVNDKDNHPMAFSVKVTPLKREDSSLRGIGRIYLDDSFVISNVRMIEGKKGMFISMPDYRTDKIKDGKPIYREIVFPVTKEFREKLYGEFDKEYEKEKQKGKDSPDKEADRAAEKNKAKKDKDPEKEKEVAQTR